MVGISRTNDRYYFDRNTYGSSNSSDSNDGGRGRRVSGRSHHSADSSNTLDIR